MSMFNPFFYSIIKQTIADEFITHKHKHTHKMIIEQLRTSSIDLFKRERWSFAQNQNLHIHVYVIATKYYEIMPLWNL